MFDLVAVVVVVVGEEPVTIVSARVNAFPSFSAVSCSNSSANACLHWLKLDVAH
jgi:hypothetical protein